ncbi:MAG TPA: hypothetical protein DCM87_18215 [Planctomycetes bacterium]|nr:hypothetical protein [Planctomycetota bacterium]
MMFEPTDNCAAHRCLSRRCFLAATAAAPAAYAAASGAALPQEAAPLAPQGPAASAVTRVKAAFVRRKGEYGMRWPGAVFDGEKARRDYTEALRAAAKALAIEVDLRPAPIHSRDEAKAWVEEAKAATPDGLLVLLLDRQEHAWPTATLAAESGIPTIVHAPLGTAFTTNTAPLAGRAGCVILGTDDFGEVVTGLKMFRARRKLADMRYVVLRGAARRAAKVPYLGTNLQYVPASDFLAEYMKTPDTDEIKALAKAYIDGAMGIVSGTPQDVLNGIKSYVVARTILAREKGDAITMDCLGALGASTVSLPCISWSYMLDQGIPAACEADINAATTHALALYLLGVPGFQQDPVADTSRGTLIGAHCTCPTRVRGPAAPPLKYDIRHHHGNRDAVPRPIWEIGQRMTVVQFVLGADETVAPRLIVAAGSVVENRAVPPAGGCVVSVECKLDGVDDCLAFPGFHQLFLYGDHTRTLLAYCRLFGIEPVVA